MQSLIKYFVMLIVAVFGTALHLYAQAQASELRLKHFNVEKNVALQYYDPVAYFTQGRAIKGSKTYTTNYQGVMYYFSSDANKKLFLASPAKYEPQYGGWCAYAMGDKGEKVSVDPETFKILNGKLYLFYNAYFNNTLKSWNKNETNLKNAADKYWSNTIKK